MSLAERSPLKLSILPARMLSRVVLPAPEAPIITLTSAALKIPVTPCRIVFSWVVD